MMKFLALVLLPLHLFTLSVSGRIVLIGRGFTRTFQRVEPNIPDTVEIRIYRAAEIGVVYMAEALQTCEILSSKTRQTEQGGDSKIISSFYLTKESAQELNKYTCRTDLKILDRPSDHESLFLDSYIMLVLSFTCLMLGLHILESSSHAR